MQEAILCHYSMLTEICQPVPTYCVAVRTSDGSGLQEAGWGACSSGDQGEAPETKGFYTILSSRMAILK